MGSPVSVTVANIVMEDIEERALATCSLHPPFWKRYVDDTLTALPRDQIEQFHQHINSIEPSIQFTIEESNGSIPFLDTRVIRHDDGGELLIGLSRGMPFAMGNEDLLVVGVSVTLPPLNDDEQLVI